MSKTALDINQQVDVFKGKLAEYRTKIGLPNISQINDVDRFLNLTSADFRALTTEDCAEAAYILQQRALYIQKEFNQLKSYHSWIDNKIRKAIAEYGDFKNKYLSFDEKRSVVTLPVNDEALARLEQLRMEAVIKMNELDSLSHRIDNIGRLLLEIYKGKKYAKSE